MFKIGEKVVCIDSSTIYTGRIKARVKKGEIYTIIGFSNCCMSGLILKEIHCDGVKRCDCGAVHPNNTYTSIRFRKLNHDFAENLCKEIAESFKTEAICN